MRLALYQPDIPQNAGTLLRLGACLGVAVDLIEPCGFIFDDQRLRRSAMDYLAHAEIVRHSSWREFEAGLGTARLVLLSAHAPTAYTEFSFRDSDVLLVGQESAGVPDEVRARADAALRIPLRPGLRSINVALAAAMVIGEAMRQTEQFPETKP